jgi:hypothetical protein
MPAPRTQPSRRRVLAGLGALASTAVVGRVAATTAGREDATVPTDSAATAATAATLDPLATVGADGLSEAVVDDSGTVVYGALRSGFVVVDVSDPASPDLLVERRNVLADVDGGPLDGVFDVKVSGDRLLVAGPNGGPSGIRGFALFDVRDPASPERVAYYEAGTAVHNADIDGDTAYLTGSSRRPEAVVVVDVADDDPEEVATWHPGMVGEPTDSCHDLYAQDDRLYVAFWDAGTWILDVSDPSRPLPVSYVRNVAPEGDSRGFELPGNDHYVQPNADASLLAVGREAVDNPDTDIRGGPGDVDLFDVGDERNPRHLATIPSPGEATSHNLGWRGDRLYSSWYRSGVTVHDVSDPTTPRRLAHYRSDAASFWTAKPIAEGFVGSSFYDPSQGEGAFSGTGSRLYVFPEPEGDGSPETPGEPAGGYVADAVTATPTPERTSTEAGTTTESATPTTNTPSVMPPTSSARPDTPTASATDDTGSTPGFGALAALLGGGLAGWRLWRRENEGE